MELEQRSFKVPAWVGSLVGFMVLCCGGVAWAYGTFVTIRERDLVKSLFEIRLDNIERKQDRMESKIDKLLERSGEK